MVRLLCKWCDSRYMTGWVPQHAMLCRLPYTISFTHTNTKHREFEYRKRIAALLPSLKQLDATMVPGR